MQPQEQLKSPQNAETTSRVGSCPLATVHEVEPCVESADTEPLRTLLQRS